ncbi:MAG: ATP-dependent DNA helicase RecG [Pseudomonadales bacterium]|nr:ATP-dependent DNA helicase RecG [Pseudomonadales bacterium]
MSLTEKSVLTLKGIGPALATKLERLGITTLHDLLFHLPLRYEDRTRVTAIGAAQTGQTVVLEGDIVACDVAYGRRRSLLAYLQDSTGKIALRFFHFSKAQQANLASATSIRCFGEVRNGASGLEIYHPEYEKTSSPLEKTLTSVYPATDGLSQSRYRSLVTQVLIMLDEEPLAELLNRDNSIDINAALMMIHQPPADADILALMSGTHPAQAQLAFEELLAHHASLRYIRAQVDTHTAYSLAPPSKLCAELITNLGFELTGAQQHVLEDISADLAKANPMLRLLQGDVGSGKTVVAAAAAVQAAENNLQAAIMAPTEVLAEQHFVTFSQWLTPLGFTVAWLSGKVKGKARGQELEKIQIGQANIIVGTHALFQSDVVFHNLGLIIIDEQHRFGVHQRLALREKGGGNTPHQLIMTATPIPRTLTMSMYADMDASIIDELPPGRTPVTTSVLPDSRRPEVIERIRSLCGNGAQAYWVCTLIEESEVLESQAAEVTLKDLTEALPELRIALIHGRMNYPQKAETMAEFKNGNVDLLVATTVIEVGVDVPNATLMIIENSERLGLSQLHQLRGRVGRGSGESHCLLLYHPPLREMSKQRLAVMRHSNDGFFIAEEDLKIRGPGELLGSKQSGALQFKIADLIRDAHMLTEVRTTSNAIFELEPDKVDMIIRRWTSIPDELSQV